jgi:hypothetical protein
MHWQVQELGSVLVPVALLAQTDGTTLRNCLSPQKAVLLGLFWIHYCNRLAVAVHACLPALPGNSNCQSQLLTQAVPA